MLDVLQRDGIVWLRNMFCANHLLCHWKYYYNIVHALPNYLSVSTCCALSAEIKPDKCVSFHTDFHFK